jgi:hypothetical protein
MLATINTRDQAPRPPTPQPPLSATIPGSIQTMTDRDLEQSILDGSLWEQFCDGLKEAGNIVMRPETPADLFNRAEGFRYLTRLLRAGLENQVEFSDPRFPQFFSLADETKKIGNDNPDNFYQNANISGRYDYRINGQRGTTPFLSMGTKAGSYATTGGQEPTGQIKLSDLEINADGSFEVIVSSRPQPGNWLPMREDSNAVLVRQTFHDRKAEIPTALKIECLNPDRDATLVPVEFAENLLNTVGFVRNTANLFVNWMEIYRGHINQLPSDDQARCTAAGGDAAIHYLQSFWKLAPDEAQVLEVKRVPNCRTWNFQLSNYWMESLDFRYHKISVNKHSAVPNPDGTITIVVAHQDPGPNYPNWLTTAGHDQGGNLFRWVDADEFPPVDARVVKFAEL